MKLVFLRASDQGHGPAQAAAAAAISDLQPRWLILIGIAGGVPASEFSIGDVLLADSFLNFSVTAAKPDQLPELRTTGGSVHREVEPILTDVRAWEHRLGPWNQLSAIGVPTPVINAPFDINAGCYVGSDRYRTLLRDSLRYNFPDLPSIRASKIETGAVGTSNELVKDPRRLEQWLTTGRQITHVEMEYGGVERAARYTLKDREIPVLSIRGISDIVGFKRSPECTAYACHTSASFFHALIMVGPPEYLHLTSQPNSDKSRLNEPHRIYTLSWFWSCARTWIHYLGRREAHKQLPASTVTPSIEEIISSFKKSSTSLLKRRVPQEDQIVRPEFETIVEALRRDDETSMLFVLGDPGTGKTSLLAHLASDAVAAGQITLAIKADMYPSDQSFDAWSKSVLGLDLTFIDAIRAVSTSSKVLVVLDQLDALSSTVDFTSDRLNAILSFIDDCLRVPGVRVVGSCRRFDYSHDARFSSLNAEIVNLSLPSWEAVIPLLTKYGLHSSEAWPEDFRELLRNPQHLSIYIDRFVRTGMTDPFTSYQLMLDDLWAHRIAMPT